MYVVATFKNIFKVFLFNENVSSEDQRDSTSSSIFWSGRLLAKQKLFQHIGLYLTCGETRPRLKPIRFAAFNNMSCNSSISIRQLFLLQDTRHKGHPGKSSQVFRRTT